MDSAIGTYISISISMAAYFLGLNNDEFRTSAFKTLAICFALGFFWPGFVVYAIYNQIRGHLNYKAILKDRNVVWSDEDFNK